MRIKKKTNRCLKNFLKIDDQQLIIKDEIPEYQLSDEAKTEIQKIKETEEMVKNLCNEIYVNNDDGSEKFCKATMNTKISPIKKKYVRGNQMPFMTKELSKEIMARSIFTNNYLMDKTDKSRFLYTQKIYKSVALLRNTKKNYFENLDILMKIHFNENGKLIQS